MNNIGNSTSLTLDLAIPSDPSDNYYQTDYDQYNIKPLEEVVLCYKCLYQYKYDLEKDEFGKDELEKLNIINKAERYSIQELPEIVSTTSDNNVILEKPSISYIPNSNEQNHQNICTKNENESNITLHICIPIIKICNKPQIENLNINCNSNFNTVLELKIDPLSFPSFENINLNLANVKLLIMSQIKSSNTQRQKMLQMASIRSNSNNTMLLSSFPIKIKNNVYSKRNSNQFQYNRRLKSPSVKCNINSNHKKRSNSHSDFDNNYPIPLLINNKQIQTCNFDDSGISNFYKDCINKIHGKYTNKVADNNQYKFLKQIKKLFTNNLLFTNTFWNNIGNALMIADRNVRKISLDNSCIIY